MAKTEDAKKPKTEKPSIEMTGKGTLRTAAERAVEHNRKICEASGGSYNSKNGSCD